jgi:hypothetical protein
MVTVSSMFLSAGGDAAENLIVGEPGPALSTQLDKAVIYGDGGDAPVGILLDPATHKISVGTTPDWWTAITDAEERRGLSDVSELRTASITSRTMRKEFRAPLRPALRIQSGKVRSTRSLSIRSTPLRSFTDYGILAPYVFGQLNWWSIVSVWRMPVRSGLWLTCSVIMPFELQLRLR